MALEVYQFSVSPYAWRVLLALEIKRLPYEPKLLQFSRQEHKSPEFLQLNPRGQIPVLKEGDYAIYESLAILFYLDRRYEEPPLFGRTPQEAGTIMRSVCETSAYVERPVIEVVNPLCAHDPNDKLDINQEAVSKLQEELRRVNTALTYSKWLAGYTISAADIMLFPFIQLLLWALSKPVAASLHLGFTPIEIHYPAIARWIKAVEALPGYQNTYPTPWRSSPLSYDQT